LEPINLLRSGNGRYLRGFKLTSQFVESVYTKIAEQEKKVGIDIARDNA